MAVTIRDLTESSHSYVSFNASRNLEGKAGPIPEETLLKDTKITSLIQELQDWPGPQISSHKSARQFFHKLVFLADIGLNLATPGIAGITEKILSETDETEIPCLHTIIPEGYGGVGKPVKAWALCDAPNTLYALIKLGVRNQKIDTAVENLASLSEPFGFSCRVSPSLGSWRGPGKKTEPCPYATLIMLKLLLLVRDKFKNIIGACAETLLDLWENSRIKHPYIFYMGNDFRKLKLPFIWYDLLHVVFVLSQVKEAPGDQRFQEMYSIIKGKETEAGFIPESVYQPWKDWDFGQKKQPSEGMTYWVRRIEAAIEKGS